MPPVSRQVRRVRPRQHVGGWWRCTPICSQPPWHACSLGCMRAAEALATQPPAMCCFGHIRVEGGLGFARPEHERCWTPRGRPVECAPDGHRMQLASQAKPGARRGSWRANVASIEILKVSCNTQSVLQLTSLSLASLDHFFRVSFHAIIQPWPLRKCCPKHEAMSEFAACNFAHQRFAKRGRASPPVAPAWV
jgi:hypothetical protein